MSKLKIFLYLLLLFLIPLLVVPFLKRTKTEFEDELRNRPAISVDNTRDTTQFFAIAVHGGAGMGSPSNIPDSVQVAYRTAMYQVLEHGRLMLMKGDSAHHVAVAVVALLEDNPLFNAGKGAILTNDGRASLDASIMTGWDKNAGAVAGVERVKNPIKAALAVLQKSPYLFLSSSGADAFAKSVGLEMVPNSYFITEKAKQRLKQAQEQEKSGTVGCVVRDKYGNLTAATSTGGMNNKRFGRIGDSPIIGAGTWADNQTCAISCTGWGEYFIRNVVAFNVHALMLYARRPLSIAAYEVIHNQVAPMGGYGALIAVSRNGDIVVEGNATTIIYGFIDKFGTLRVALSK